MAWILQASDAFTRANETPLAGNWGAWASVDGSAARLRLSSNTVISATLGSDAYAGYNARVWAQDHSSKVTIVCAGTGSTNGYGLVVRLVEGDHTSTFSGYRLVVNKAGSNNAALTRITNSVTATLAQYTSVHVDGDTWELRVIGLGVNTVLDVLHNDASIGTFSDNGGSGLSGIGITGLSYSSTMTSGTLDNWEGYEYIADAQSLAPHGIFRSRGG